MRNVAVLSVLMLGTSALTANAGNYVAQKNYNNPDVVVNMDVMGASGFNTAPMSNNPPIQLRPPVLQQPLMPPAARFQPLPPLRPPVLQRPISPEMAQPSRMPPQPLYQPEPQEEPQAEPMDITAQQPRPMTPPPAVMPEPVAPARMMAQPPADIQPPQPFSTRELAASAPAPVMARPPEPLKEPKSEQTPKIAPKVSFAEKPVHDEAATENADVKPARELLAQAREQAGPDAAHQERQVVLFDTPPAPAPKAATEKIAETKLKPQPLPESQIMPDPVAMPAPVMPAAMPPPIAQAAPQPNPMTVRKADESMVMLKPTPLPDVAPAAIPLNSAAMKKAETIVDDFEAYRLLFDRSSAELKPTEREVLDNIINKLKSDENIKLQLRAYADGTPDNTAQARRLSLSRALSVRAYLIQQGIVSSRMDVRALGMGSTVMGDVANRVNIPGDRVDIIFTR